MDVRLVFLTGLLSIATQYGAVILTTICLVDFFSYRTKKVLFITASYLSLLPIIHLAVADFLTQTRINGSLNAAMYRLCYDNIMIAITCHVLLGLLVIVLYSGIIKSGIVSLANHVRDTVFGPNMKRSIVLED